MSELGEALPQRPQRRRNNPRAAEEAASAHARELEHLQQTKEEQEQQYSFEYLDHTADVQLHAWGSSLEEAFAATALAMMNYQTPLWQIRRQVTRQGAKSLLSRHAAEVSVCRLMFGGGTHARARAHTHTHREVAAEGHDLYSLLYNFLDEVLFTFHTELVVFRDLKVTNLDRESWTISATGQGELFDRSRHEQGTEVKAVTYSAMQVYEDTHKKKPGTHIYVIVDI